MTQLRFIPTVSPKLNPQYQEGEAELVGGLERSVDGYNYWVRVKVGEVEYRVRVGGRQDPTTKLQKAAAALASKRTKKA